ncbi:MAG: DUF1428 domain-containing protein [Planctomycetes bacterium]|nr:DUF1428 domain-containing protein [Planctomycetota bacterium]
MKRYVDGYVLPIKKRNLKAYRKMAAKAGKVWMKHGALQYVECAGEDLKSMAKWGCVTFPKLAKAKAGETVIFAYVVYKSRAHRDKVNAKVMKEFTAHPPDCETKKVPFEMRRMTVGGFETIVCLG